MYPEIYLANVRPDGSASYFDINPEPPPLSIRDRGWDGVVFEREYFEPFETGEIVYDEHMIGICMGQDIPILHATDGFRYEGVYWVGELVISPAGQPVQWRVESGGGASEFSWNLVQTSWLRIS